MNATSHAATAAQRAELEARPIRNIATVEPIEGIEVIPAYRADDNSHWLTVACPNGWPDVQKLTKKILRFEGRIYRWRSWNSDRNVSTFLACRESDVAMFVVPKK